jgi:hypothetical protein
LRDDRQRRRAFRGRFRVLVRSRGAGVGLRLIDFDLQSADASVERRKLLVERADTRIGIADLLAQRSQIRRGRRGSGCTRRRPFGRGLH